MVIEICVAIATGVFVVLAIFLVMALISLVATLKQTRSFLSHAHRDLHALSEESIDLIKNASETVADVKMKTEALNFLFKPLFAINKHAVSKKKELSDTSDLIQDLANLGVDLYKKMKKRR